MTTNRAVHHLFYISCAHHYESRTKHELLMNNAANVNAWHPHICMHQLMFLIIIIMIAYRFRTYV